MKLYVCVFYKGTGEERYCFSRPYHVFDTKEAAEKWINIDDNRTYYELNLNQLPIPGFN
jgi:hypothetical protein